MFQDRRKVSHVLGANYDGADVASLVMCPEMPASVFENLEERYIKDMTEKGGNFPGVIVYGQKVAA